MRTFGVLPQFIDVLNRPVASIDPLGSKQATFGVR